MGEELPGENTGEPVGEVGMPSQVRAVVEAGEEVSGRGAILDRSQGWEEACVFFLALN